MKYKTTKSIINYTGNFVGKGNIVDGANFHPEYLSRLIRAGSLIAEDVRRAGNDKKDNKKDDKKGGKKDNKKNDKKDNKLNMSNVNNPLGDKKGVEDMSSSGEEEK